MKNGRNFRCEIPTISVKLRGALSPGVATRNFSSFVNTTLTDNRVAKAGWVCRWRCDDSNVEACSRGPGADQRGGEGRVAGHTELGAQRGVKGDEDLAVGRYCRGINRNRGRTRRDY